MRTKKRSTWELTLLGERLLRSGRTRRARVVLEAAARADPFHILAGSLLIQAAQAEGDHAGALRARNLTFERAGAELPPEPW